MNPIHAAAVEIQDFARARAWRFCIIGALAVERWGEPRLTHDVDLTILTGFGGEEKYVDALLAAFEARRPDAREFALRHRVLLLVGGSGAPIDVSLGAMPFEERAVSRASPFHVAPDVELWTCSAEDLVVFKAFAGRAKDWLDVEGVVVRQGARLDQALVWRELTPLLELKGTPEAAERLRRILGKARR
jgi:hypothetical protein